MQDFEKLGLFYLGKPVDAKSGALVDEPLLYDSRDLVTHAVCLGMTGSGKTGLCIALLEEAAIDGVPALVIDPKGDLTNLLLTFPELRPADFEPWVQEEDARRKGLDVPAYAAAEAERWKKGLASWGEDGERIRRLKAAASFRIFTPGSAAGEPISILATFAAPPPELVDDNELFADRVQSTATSLLGLVGVAGDPLRSREHILISSLLDRAWRAGAGYDLAQLIADIQKPPLDKVGVLPVESFFPAKERFELAMTVNALLAAPGFDALARRGRRSTCSSCSTRATAGRRSPCCRSRISPTPSACSSSRCCSIRRSPGCARVKGRAACGRCSTWTRSSASCRRPRIRRRRSRC